MLKRDGAAISSARGAACARNDALRTVLRTFDAIHRLIRRGHEIRGHLHAGGLVRRGVRWMRVGNRHRRILILGGGFERLAGDLEPQILGNRNAQYAGERDP